MPCGFTCDLIHIVPPVTGWHLPQLRPSLSLYSAWLSCLAIGQSSLGYLTAADTKDSTLTTGTSRVCQGVGCGYMTFSSYTHLDFIYFIVCCLVFEKVSYYVILEFCMSARLPLNLQRSSSLFFDIFFVFLVLGFKACATTKSHCFEKHSLSQ